MDRKQKEQVLKAARLYTRRIVFSESDPKRKSKELEFLLKSFDGEQTASYLRLIKSKDANWQAVKKSSFKQFSGERETQ